MNWYKISQNNQARQHKVLKGETLSSISKKYFNNSNFWNEILKFNPQIENPNDIKENDIINIPTLPGASPVADTKEKQNVSQDMSVGFKEYVVVKGDSLSLIAKKQLGDERRWKEIQDINGIKDPSSISIGDKLKIPLTDSGASDSSSTDVSDDGNLGISADQALEELKSMISKNEGGYGSYNKGKSGDTPKPEIDITKLTIKQIMDKQSLPLGNSNRLFAVGKYQFTPHTLKEAISNKNLGVSISDLFSPQNQEKLFPYLLYKRTNLMAYLSGKSDNLDAAVNDLAKEFASLPTTSGAGYYDNDKAKNKAKGGIKKVEKIKLTLQSLRDSGIFK